MKYIIIILTTLTSLSACQKEDAPLQRNCNCGTVVSDGVDGNCYWLELRNKCSGNKEIFCVDGDKWITAYVGTNFCITNIDSW